MRGLKSQGGSMETSCRVLSNGQGTLRMDREKTRYPQERGGEERREKRSNIAKEERGNRVRECRSKINK